MEERRADPDVATAADIGGSATSRARRRVVTVDDVAGVLAQRDGGWVLANDLEVRVLEALRGYGGARWRLSALAATLDAGLADGARLRRVSRVLDEITVRSPHRVRVADELLGAVGYACAHWDHHGARGWLSWALSAQLDSGLVKSEGLPGPGVESIVGQSRLRDGGFGRETHWICEMPDGFWDRLRSHPKNLTDVVAACDVATPARMLAKLADEKRHDRELLDLVASHPRTPKRVLETIAAESYAMPQLRLRVAQNRNISRRVLDWLGCDHDELTRTAVALNPKTSRSTLARLAGNAAPRVRVAVACSTNVSARVLVTLAQDSEMVVRSWVAANPTTPPEALELLLADRHWVVRACAAANPSTPIECVESRVTDRAIRVRGAVAQRAGVAPVVLETLAGDLKPRVRAAAGSNPAAGGELLACLASDGCEQVRVAVAANPAAPAGVLEMLAADTGAWTRSWVAYNPSTAAVLLRLLAADVDDFVRRCVAANEAAPGDVLETLAGDGCAVVRAHLARNPSAPAAAVRHVVANAGEDAGEHLGEYVKMCAAENPALPGDVFDTLIGDASYRVRATAARSPHSSCRCAAPSRDLNDPDSKKEQRDVG